LKQEGISVSQDPSPFHLSNTQSPADIEYRLRLDAYFSASIGTNVQKLENFPKYVPRQALTKFIAKYEIFKQILPVAGSILEFGVFAGGGLMTWALLSALLEPINFQRKVVGFDTFSGFPQVSTEDTQGKSEHAATGGYAMDSYDDLRECIRLFDANRVLNHIPKVSLVRGDVSTTLPAYLAENQHTVASLIYLDLDLYQPTVAVLKHMLPRMPRGAIIAFDEVNVEAWPGETLAVMHEVGIRNLRLQRIPFEPYISYAVIE
jgi:Macrocin-O-methyltransferase (TylF)